jgi:hypothetical protein
MKNPTSNRLAADQNILRVFSIWNFQFGMRVLFSTMGKNKEFSIVVVQYYSAVCGALDGCAVLLLSEAKLAACASVPIARRVHECAID